MAGLVEHGLSHCEAVLVQAQLRTIGEEEQRPCVGFGELVLDMNDAVLLRLGDVNLSSVLRPAWRLRHRFVRLDRRVKIREGAEEVEKRTCEL